MLKVVEYADVNLIVRTTLLQKLTQRILDIILIRQLQDRLIHNATEPYNSLTHKLWSPLTRTYQPRGLLACKFLCCSLVDDKLDVRMLLQVARRYIARNLLLDNLLHCRSLILAPRHKHNLIGTHNSANTHCDSHLWSAIEACETLRLHLS